MAYNNFYPQYYQPYYQPIQQIQPIQQPIYPTQIPATPQQNVSQKADAPQPQVQSGGFVPVPSEEVARNFPVGNGLSVTFKDENAPYVYTKTKGFSQLDVPVFEKYRLVKEEDAPVDASEPISEPKEEVVNNDAIDEIKDDIEQIREDIDDIQKQIDALKDVSKKTNTTTKKRSDGDI